MGTHLAGSDGTRLSKRLLQRSTYYLRTNPGVGLATKKQATNGLVGEIRRLLDGGKPPFRVVSLPGPWWNFEKEMQRRVRKRIIYYCCEREPSIFQMACLKMPWLPKSSGKGSRRTSKQKTVRELNGADFFTNSRECLLFCADVWDYLQVTLKTYHVVYLDFCSPVTPRFLEDVGEVAKVLEPGGLFAFSVIAARENAQIFDLISSAGSRINFLKSWIEPLGFQYIASWTWNDASPMLQLLFKSTAQPPDPQEDQPPVS